MIEKKDIIEAAGVLRDYKEGKRTLEARIIDDEQWWKLRHRDAGKRMSQNLPEESIATSAWLFNSITSKHADIMDNYPEAVCLPREESDSAAADSLSKIIPVITERSGFEQTYSDNAWYKLKHGTCAYGVFWNGSLENGLGDIDIRPLDLLNVFWQPGITDIQASRNLFIVTLCERDMLESEYPALKSETADEVVDIGDYIYDDSYTPGDKCVVVDWYYKKAVSGKTLLHYCKFSGETLLFASENEPEFAETGWYNHGMYPVVLDVLYPEQGTPYGFGIIAVTKDPQTYIDRIDRSILDGALLASRVRYFAKKNAGINVEQFLDTEQPIVEVEGDIGEERLKQITVNPPSGLYLNIRQMKIDELKETSSNRDFAQGATSGGVTAASAIEALQEAGNKQSRDMIAASYRAFVKVINLVVELVRQFYGEARSFRITGAQGTEFLSYSNRGISEAERRPIFDIDVRAQKKNPYSRISQNEMAKELFRIGAFSPENREQTLLMLEMMDFDGVERLRNQLSTKGIQ